MLSLLANLTREFGSELVGWKLSVKFGAAGVTLPKPPTSLTCLVKGSAVGGGGGGGRGSGAPGTLTPILQEPSQPSNPQSPGSFRAFRGQASDLGEERIWDRQRCSPVEKTVRGPNPEP